MEILANIEENVTIVSGVTLNYTYCVSACDSSCKKNMSNRFFMI